VMHAQKAALELFAREIAPAGTSWSPGTTGADGRPRPSPAIKQFAFLLDKRRVSPAVAMGDELKPVAVPVGQDEVPRPVRPEIAAEPGPAPLETIEVPLARLAWGRSGDKGDSSNIGIIARRPDWLPLLRAQLTEARVAQWLAHLVHGSVTRYDLPGIHALNFLCTRALDGGGMASLRNDPLGKGMAQILLTLPVRVPVSWGLQVPESAHG
ncbi:MAG TPA: terpene utilization protein AtuA, partial [Ramlibacter sp.]|nr:terpene utilization protein AtuA [Ramlibacter sp.]